jgi:hypothetical protein
LSRNSSLRSVFCRATKSDCISLSILIVALTNVMCLLNLFWHVLSWNVRGLNSADKWPAIRNKIEESNASTVFLQETKKMEFDVTFIKINCPSPFRQIRLYSF